MLEYIQAGLYMVREVGGSCRPPFDMILGQRQGGCRYDATMLKHAMRYTICAMYTSNNNTQCSIHQQLAAGSSAVCKADFKNRSLQPWKTTAHRINSWTPRAPPHPNAPNTGQGNRCHSCVACESGTPKIAALHFDNQSIKHATCFGAVH